MMSLTFLFLISYIEFINDHFAEDRIGFIFFYSRRTYIEKSNFTVSIFGQKKFLDIFEIKIDIPSGISGRKYVISDLSLSLKVNPSEIYMNPSFSLIFELPTGTRPATSNKFTISPLLFLKGSITEKLSVLGFISGSFSPEKTKGTYNSLFPRASEEIGWLVGLKAKIKTELYVQSDLYITYEEFKVLGIQPQIKFNLESDEFKSSVFIFSAHGKSIRRGFGIGATLMFLF